jgi:hypothetical protein
MKLKIFSDQNYIPQNFEIITPLLVPFWQKASNVHPLYFNYAQIGHSCFELSSLEEADITILPIPWELIRGFSLRSRTNQEAQNTAIQFAKQVENQNKPLIIFFSGVCSAEQLPLKDAFVFRTSLYRSSRKKKDFSAPLWTQDIVKNYLKNKLIIRQKREKPIIGFCGRARKNLEIKIKSAMYYGWKLVNKQIKENPLKGDYIRTAALNYLSKSPLVKTNFIIRDKFVTIGQTDPDLKEKFYLEFLKNMIESDYIVCSRGASNTSFRFFETLCSGRIPVFIDTDCVLPYDFFIDWNKYCVWVDENELPWIDEKIMDFHSQLSSSEYIELQHECRAIWVEWLSPEGFHKNLYRHFNNI